MREWSLVNKLGNSGIWLFCGQSGLWAWPSVMVKSVLPAAASPRSYYLIGKAT
ncbi:MAG: hypothetical protein ACR2OA_10580 [Rubripirellula sp.]